MNTLKNILAFSLILLFAGCATVTDANLDAPENNDNYITTTIDSEDNWFSRVGNDMDPIIDERDTNDF